jgi:hypothetical protein
MIENVIFDVDGTLWDCSAAVAKAWNAVYERRGLSRRFSVSDVRSCMGLTMEEIAEKYFCQTEKTERDEIVQSCIAEQNALLPKEGGKLYPNIRETLKTLSARFGVYIVSNCECGYIETMLSFARLESFVDGFLCAGMTGKDKGENLRLLMAEHALKNCVYVGDTRMDEAACQKAEIPFIWASYGFGRPDAPAAVIKDFSEIPDLLERF